MSGIGKVLFIVAAITRNGKGNRNSRTTTTCTPYTLLIVKPLRGNITKQNGMQRADIDSGFHCGCDAEQINFFHEAIFILVSKSLKQTLTARRFLFIRLPGQFFTMQSKRLDSGGNKKAVIILICALIKGHWFRREKVATIGTHPY